MQWRVCIKDIDMKKIEVIPSTHTEENAEQMLLNQDGTISVEKIDSVYYPYHYLHYNLIWEGKRLGNLNKTVLCLVDMVHGRPAVADGEPIVETLEADDEIIMQSKLTTDEVDSIGHDFILKLHVSKAKMFHTPKIEIPHRKTIYKKFFVVHCTNEYNEAFLILFDTIDGGITVLV